jgi:hypothetical protein
MLHYLHTGDEEGLTSIFNEPQESALPLMATSPPVSWEIYWKYYYLGLLRFPEQSSIPQDFAYGFLNQAELSGNRHFQIGTAYGQSFIWRKIGRISEAVNILYNYGTPPDSCWYVIGPFEGRNGFNKVFAPEKNPRLDISYDGRDGIVSWRMADDGIAEGILDFRAIFSQPIVKVHYAHLQLYAPTARKAQIRIGSGDPVKLWLNEDLILASNRYHSTQLDDFVIPVTLLGGKNSVLVKIVQRTGGYGSGLYFRVTDPDGKIFEDIIFGHKDIVS